MTPVSPIGNETQWEGQWCQKVLHNKSHPVGVSHFPKRLPAGWFLICGNRAWNGIPARMMGGPCTIGQLSLALPHHHPNRPNPVRWKRDITETLDDTCDDNVRLWNKLEIIFASFFTPGVAAARAHRNLEKLSCWVVKQANLTSRVLSDLAESMSSVQHAVLQNRMAIDFLLLAHGHGCEDFDGMCCTDLEDKSRSIHEEIKQLIDHSQKIKEDVGLFGLEGLTKWLGLGGWIKGLLQGLLVILIIVVIGLLCLSCALSCIKRMFERALGQTLLVQKERGGIVREWLKDKGHESMEQLHDQSLF